MEETAKEWYGNTAVRYEIVKQTPARECGFLKIGAGKEGRDLMTRGFKIHAVRYLEYFFDKLNFFKQPTNLYYSVARVQNIPTFTLNLGERVKSMEQFNTDFDKYVTDYDLMIDFDPEAKAILPEDLAKQALKLTDMLDKRHITYSIRISGKGIHVYINGTEFPHIPVFEKPKLYKQISQQLRELNGLTYVDDNLYTDDKICRRYCKIPYTMDMKTGNICLPIHKHELEDFNPNIYKAEIVINNRKIFNRGVPLHNTEQESDIKGWLQDIAPD